MFKEEFFIPEYFNKQDPNQWQEAGSESIYDKMKKEVKKRLESYQAPDITKEQEKLLDSYIPADYRLGI
jgi:trimethylamine--corrinoid protein Co-methyltransferase